LTIQGRKTLQTWFFYAVFFPIGLSFFSCSEKESNNQNLSNTYTHIEYRDTSTIQMARLLSDQYATLPALQTNYKNRERAAHFLAMAKDADLVDEVQLSIRGSFELINSGQNEAALSVLNTIYEKVSRLQFPEKNQILFNIIGLRAITYFRIAELEKCRENHNSYSCILPLAPEGMHRLRTGSENAIRDIETILELKQDPNFIYLLNLAYMTLGGYPDEVPEAYRVPLVMDESKTGIKPFVNIGSQLGVDDYKLSGGVIIEDFDNDGDIDILSSSWNLRDNLAYYENQGNGSYAEKHTEAGLKGITGGLNMIQGDYDNDGYIDMLVLRGAWLPTGKNPNSLLKNNGDGSFTDVTIESGIFSLFPTQTAAWADFNNDGFLDLYIGNETYEGYSANACELFLNSGKGTFTNIASTVNADVVGYIKGVACSDYDNDGDQDIFLSNLSNKNILLENISATNDFGFEFKDVSDQAGIEYPLESFPTWFFDFDNDGLEDLFVASYPISYYNNLASEYLNELLGKEAKSESPRLYKNLGNGTFSDITSKVELDKVCFTMGSNFGDFDNDGFLDMYLGTGEPDMKAVIPNRAFLNNNGKAFREITSQAGLGHLQKGHAVSFIDLDNDGDQDIYAVMGGAFEGDVFYNALFENPGNDNGFIKLSFQGVKSNRFGLGAKVTIKLSNGKKIYRTMSSGSSFGSNMQTRMEIGIPQGISIEALAIDWPSGAQQNFTNPHVNHWYKITEGQSALEKMTFSQQPFVLSNTHHHH